MSKEAAEPDSTSRPGADGPGGQRASNKSQGAPRGDGRTEGPDHGRRLQRECEEARLTCERRTEKEQAKTIPHCWLIMGCLQGRHRQWAVSAERLPPRGRCPGRSSIQTKSGFMLQRQAAAPAGAMRRRWCPPPTAKKTPGGLEGAYKGMSGSVPVAKTTRCYCEQAQL